VRALAIASVTVTVLGLTTAPAHANTWSAKDRRADVRATVIPVAVPSRADACPEPREHRAPSDRRRDILSLEVDHGTDAVVIALGMRDVARRDAVTTYDFHVRTPKAAYQIDVFPSTAALPAESGNATVFLTKEPDYPAPSDIKDCAFGTVSTVLPCEGIGGDIDPRLDRIVVTVPRQCLRQPAWVRVAAEVYGHAHPKEGRLTLFTDYWGPHGVQRHGFLPPFGPRVHSP